MDIKLQYPGGAVDKYELAKAEIADIEEKLAALRARRDALLRFIEMGNSLFSESPAKMLKTPLSVFEGVRSYTVKIGERDAQRNRERNALKHASMQDQIIRCALDLIELVGAAPSRDIVEYALMQGINITGTDFPSKVMTVSAILSKSEKFQADRGKGWTLKEESKNP